MSAAGGPASSTEPNASTRDPEGGQGAAAAGGEAEGGAPASFSNPLQDDGAFWAPDALSSSAAAHKDAVSASEALASGSSQSGPPPEEVHDWDYLWSVADADGSGQVEKDEFESLFDEANDRSHQKSTSTMDFTRTPPIVAPETVAGLWQELAGESDAVSKDDFIACVRSHTELFAQVYSSHLTHDWCFMWDEAAQEAESVDYLSKAEVKRMFELANDRDHAGTSDRIITYKKMEELWLEMSADGKATKAAFLSSVEHNPSIYGTVGAATHKRRLDDSVATALVGAGSAVTMMMTVYTSLATRVLSPFFNNDSSVQPTVMHIMLVVLFVVGLPVLVFTKIYVRRELVYADFESVEQTRFKLQWGWIYARYRPQRWWWEGKVIVQKLVLSTIVAVLGDKDPRRCAGAQLGIMLAFIASQTLFRPYAGANANIADIGFMAIEWFNALLAFNISDGHEEMDTIWELTIAVVNLIPVFVLLSVAFEVKRDQAIRKVKDMGVRAKNFAASRPLIVAIPIVGAAAIIVSVLAAGQTDVSACITLNPTTSNRTVSNCGCVSGSFLLSLDNNEECRNCVPTSYSILVLGVSLGILVPIVSFAMNAFQKWMALTHNADTSNDLLTNARTARESIQHMAIIGAVMSHLQITRLQFNLDIPWPPLLVAVMRSVTWPFTFNLDFVDAANAFCFSQLLDDLGQLMLFAGVAASLALCSILMSYWPHRNAVHHADKADMQEHEANKKRLHEDFLKKQAVRKQHGREKANSMVLVRACLLLIAMGLGLAILQIISANKCPGRGSLLGC